MLSFNCCRFNIAYETIFTFTARSAIIDDASIATGDQIAANVDVGLQLEIQNALESNIMLELEDDDFGSFEIHQQDKKSDNLDLLQSSEGSQTDIPDELPIDTSWEDIYDNEPDVTPEFEFGTIQETSDFEGEFETQRTESLSLQNYLLDQLNMVSFSERDYAIAVAIIDAINNEGYLASSIDDIYHGLCEQLSELELDEVQVVLHRIQHFDPVGIAAIDLGDCLRLQLQQLPVTTPIVIMQFCWLHAI
jgi:RNA polymerase sigma-54 factor